jgi:hypothetical protein
MQSHSSLPLSNPTKLNALDCEQMLSAFQPEAPHACLGAIERREAFLQ